MKSIALFILTAVAAATLGGCAPAANTPANTANTAPAKAAVPTMDTLFAMDKKANEAWVNGDKAHFEGMLSDKFVSYERGERMDRAGLLAMIGTVKCDVKTWSLEDPQMATIDADTYVISYKGNFDGTCTGPDGKSMKIPTPTRAASVWVRSGDTWKGAFHSETPIIDPKAAPADAKAADSKTDAKADDKAAAARKPEAVTTIDADAADAKKPEVKKADTAKKADDAAKSDAADAKKAAAPSANTAALVALHTAGWEAFKNKDAKWFDANMTNGFAFVDAVGHWHSGKAEAIKTWTGAGEMKCEGVTTTSVKDGVATAISPTVELLTLVGTANGTCDGQKNGPIYQSAVYVKEGTAWKLAFMFEAPPMKK